MIITVITDAIGKNRPPCQEPIQVAAGLKMRAAQHGAYERKRRGIPIDQCGDRSSHQVDGKNVCLRHAGSLALAHVMAMNQTALHEPTVHWRSTIADATQAARAGHDALVTNAVRPQLEPRDVD